MWILYGWLDETKLTVSSNISSPEAVIRHNAHDDNNVNMLMLSRYDVYHVHVMSVVHVFTKTKLLDKYC